MFDAAGVAAGAETAHATDVPPPKTGTDTAADTADHAVIDALAKAVPQASTLPASAQTTEPPVARAADPASAGDRREVAFVEAGVTNYEALVEGIRSGVEVRVLDGDQDGLAQIATWAGTHGGYDAIHIISHGNQGTLSLGTASLDGDTLAVRSGDLAAIGAALRPGGDLLLYGCDVGAGSDGQAFVGALAAATGADVAASSDPTGAAAAGGNWTLEVASGRIDTVALDIAGYPDLLPLTIQTATSYATGSGPWRVAMGDFNADGKVDLLTSNLNSSTLSVLLGNGDGTFQAKADIAWGTSARALTVGDLNGDGKLDLIASSGGNSVGVMLGKGDGTFQTKVTYTTGPSPYGIATGDVNGDGKLDLVTSNSDYNGSVSVLLGRGDGTFQTKADYTVGLYPSAVTVGDFNGDGKLDLVTSNSNGSSSTVSVLLGKGDGTFQSKTDYTVGINPNSVVAADVNGDGKLDLVTSYSSNPGSVSVLLGKGDGSFQSKTDYTVGLNPSGVAVGDINGDGKLDLVTSNSANPGSVSVLLGRGDGTFQTKTDYTVGLYPGSVTVADVNGDGKPDLVVSNNGSASVSVLINKTPPSLAGTATALSLATDAGATDVSALLHAADLFSGATLTWSQVTAPSHGTLTISGATAASGAADIAPGGTITYTPAAGYSGTDSFTVQISDGTTTTTRTISVWIGQAPIAVDLQAGSDSGVSSTDNITNANTPSFDGGGAPANSTVTVFVDANANGVKDAGELSATAAADANGIWTGAVLNVSSLGNGSYAVKAYATENGVSGPVGTALTLVRQSVAPVATTANTTVTLNATGPGGTLSLGDTVTVAWNSTATGDANTDIATVTVDFGAFGGGIVAAVNNNGVWTATYAIAGSPRLLETNTKSLPMVVTDKAGNITTLSQTYSAPTYAAGSNPQMMASGDVNGDGKIDVIVANGSNPGIVSVLLGNGDGTFQAKIDSATGIYPNAIAVADFNGDGKLDVATTSGGGTNMVSVLLGNGDGTFRAKLDSYDGFNGGWISVADLNGDGKLDLVITNSSSGSLSVLLGKGDGTFQARTDYWAGSSPQPAAIGDVNGDGKLDLLSTDWSGGSVWVLLGKGDGTFQNASGVSVGSYMLSSIALGDLNGDGKLDVVTADTYVTSGGGYSTNNTVSVLLGNGDGTFQAKTDYTTGPNPSMIAVRDIDGDGKLDIVTGNTYGTGMISVLLGNGNGTFQARTDFSPATSIKSFVLADVNRDGKPDVVVLASTSVTVLANIAPPSLAGTATALSLATDAAATDVTGLLHAADAFSGKTLTWSQATAPSHGTLTISGATAASGAVDIAPGGTITYTPAAGYSGTDSFTVQISDGVNTTTRTISVWIGQAPIAVTLQAGSDSGSSNSDTLTNANTLSIDGSGAPANSTVTVFVDANGNGVKDSGELSATATAGADGAWAGAALNVASLGSGTVSVKAFATVNGVPGPVGTALNILRDVSAPRVSVANTTISPTATGPGSRFMIGDTVTVTWNNTAGGDANADIATVTMDFGAFGGGIVVAVNSNGVWTASHTIRSFAGMFDPATKSLPVVVTDRAGNSTTVSPTYASGTFATDSYTQTVAAGDLNGDGKLDLVVGNSASTVSVLLGKGDGTFQPETAYAIDSMSFSVALADLDGDGKLDIVATNYFNNTVSVLLGRGDGTFQPQVSTATAYYPRAVAVGDFNKDGKQDIVIANTNGYSVSVLLGNGAGGFQSKTDIYVYNSPYAIAVGDFNGDGKLDIVTANNSSNNVSVLLGQGDGTFQSQVSTATGSSPYAVAVGDVNGDGKADIVTANYSANTVSVLLGRGDGTFQAKVDCAVGSNPNSIAIGDVNGDGNPDLIVGDQNNGGNIPSSVSVLLGNGNGTFQAKTDYLTGNLMQSMAVGDVNGDGKPDIVTTNFYGHSVSVLMNVLPPRITGTAASQAVGDNATISPFSGVTIASAGGAAQVETVTVQLDAAAKGSFTVLNGFTDAGGGRYTFTGTAAAATAAIRGLVFTPAANRVAAGTTETTTFTISVQDNNAATDSVTTVVSTAVNDAPALTPGNPSLTAITEEQTSSAGQTVASILGTSVVDGDVGAVQGIAITAADAGNGTWQYSVDNGGSWTAFGTLSGTAALLLRTADFVRFVPNTANGTTGSFTFRGWDRTSGSAGSTADTTANGGTTAFSAASDTATITVTAVNDAPTLGGAGANQTVTDQTTVTPFAAVTIADVDLPGDTLAVTVTLDSAAKGAFTAASLTASGFTDQGGGVYGFSGTASAAQAAIRQLVFQPAANRKAPGGTETTTFTIALDDGAGGTASSAMTTVVSTSVNDAPSAADRTITIGEDASRTLVASDFGFNDADIGDALVTVKITQLPGAGSLKLNGTAVTLNQEIAKADLDANALVFTPAANGNGAGYATIGFAVSDGTAYSAGKTLTMNVTAVNDVPVLGTTARSLPAMSEDDAASAGTTVSAILASGGGMASDVDGDSLGIAVTAVSNSNGVWQYSLNGTTWTDIPTLSTTAALLLRPTDKVRFVPNADYNGTVTGGLTVKAWDQMAGTAGGTGDTTAGGGTGANSQFSASSASAGITVNPGPTVVGIDRASGDRTTAGSVDYTVTFSGAVTGVDAGDFTLTAAGPTGATITNVSGSGSTYTVTVATGSGDGTLRLDLVDDDSILDATLDAATGAPLGGVGTVSGGGFTGGQSYTIDRTAPTVSSVSVPTGKTYKLGDVLTFVVTVSEPVSGLGGSALTLTIDQAGGGSATRQASLLSSTGTTATYQYTVAATDLDGDGIAVSGLSVGTVTDGAGNALDTTLHGVGAAALVKADGVAPAVAAVTPPADRTYRAGETLDVTVTFDDAGLVLTNAAASTLDFTIGGAARSAAFLSRSGGAVTYRYTVAAGDDTAAGIVIGGLTLGTATVQDAAGNAASLSLAGKVGPTTGIRIDTTAPTVDIAASTPADGATGQTTGVQPVLAFSEPVQAGMGGSFTLRNVTDNTVVETFAVTSSRITGWGTNRLTIAPTAALARGKTFAITWDGAAVTDAAGNALAANGTTTLYDFATAANLAPVNTVVPTVTGTAAVGGTLSAGTGVWSDGDGDALTYATQWYRADDANGSNETAITGATDGSYTLTAADSGKRIRAVVTASDGNGASPSATSVWTVVTNSAPVLGGIAATAQTITDTATVLPFATVTLADADALQSQTVTVALDAAAKGTLSGAQGSYDAATGLWSFTGTAAQAQAALRALVFTPAANRAILGGSETTTFTLTVNDSVAAALVDSQTKVTATSVNDAVVIGGTQAGRAFLYGGTIAPFAAVTVTDADLQTGGLRVVIADGAGKGDFTAASTVGWTRTVAGGDIVYEKSYATAVANIGAAAQADLRALVFAPRSNADAMLGSSGTTAFRIEVADNGGWVGTLDGAVTVTEAPGNVQTGSGGGVVDTNAPTNLTTPTLRVSLLGSNAAVGDRVELLLDGGPLGHPTIRTLTAQDIADGFVQLTVTGGDLGGDGSKTLTARLSNAGGVVGLLGGPLTIRLDTTAPLAAIASLALSSDTAANGGGNGDFVTRTASQTISGTLSADLAVGETVRLSLDGGATWAAATATAGEKSWQLAGVTLSGRGTILVKVTDTAGNDGPVRAQAFIVDTAAPTTTIATAAFSDDTGISGSDFITRTAAQTIGGTLSSALSSDETVYVSLDDGASWTAAATTVGQTGWSVSGVTLAGSGTLKVKVSDAAGNDGPAVSQSYRLDQAAAAVTSVSVPADGTRRPGDTLSFTVSLSEAVTGLTGSTLAILVDQADDITATRQATLVSATGTSATYAYTVQAGDLDADGVALGALTVGVVTDSAGNALDSTLNGVGATTGVTVDGVAPVVAAVTLPEAKVYREGESLTFVVAFDDPGLVVGGADTATLDFTIGGSIGGGGRSAAFLSRSGGALTFRYTLVSGDDTAAGIGVTGLTLHGARITDGTGNEAALSLAGRVGDGSGIRVDTVAPTVASVTLPADRTYRLGDQLDVTVTWSEAVPAGGAGTALALGIGGRTVLAAFDAAGSTGTAFRYRYTVAAGDLATGGIAVIGLRLDGAVLRDGVGHAAAPDLPSLATTGILVDGVVPTVTGITAATANGAYKAGDTIVLQVGFSKAVTVAGTPTLALNTGRNAVYSGGSGTGTLTFTYTVQDGDGAADLDVAGAAALAGTIRDAAGNTARTTLPAPGSTGSLGRATDIVVDTAAPTVAGVAMPSARTYLPGETLSFTMEVGKAVTVDGSPVLRLSVGGQAREAVFNAAGSTVTRLRFDYVVPVGDNAPGGVAVLGLALNGGTIRDGAGNALATTINTVGDVGAVVVETPVPAKPSATDLLGGAGLSVGGGPTNVAQPTLAGTAAIGSTMTVLVDGKAVGTATTDASGRWSYRVATPLSDGTHSIAVVETNRYGVSGEPSAALTVTVDTTRPGVPSLPVAAGSVAAGTVNLSANARPTFSGTAEAGSTVAVLVDGAVAGRAVADASGAWSVSVANALTDGTHRVQVQATDRAGNVGDLSAATVLTIDTTAPAAPTVTQVDGTGATPVVRGTAEANSLVVVAVDGAEAGTARASGGGAWQLALPAALGFGSHTIAARARDAVGNQGAAGSTGYTVLPPPPVPASAPVAQGSANTTTVLSSSDGGLPAGLGSGLGLSGAGPTLGTVRTLAGSPTGSDTGRVITSASISRGGAGGDSGRAITIDAIANPTVGNAGRAITFTAIAGSSSAGGGAGGGNGSSLTTGFGLGGNPGGTAPNGIGGVTGMGVGGEELGIGVMPGGRIGRSNGPAGDQDVPAGDQGGQGAAPRGLQPNGEGRSDGGQGNRADAGDAPAPKPAFTRQVAQVHGAADARTAALLAALATHTPPGSRAA
ncbi:FG-GAP-like repeat-containing protein [Azospirillum canadense]|uniref:FG-GAP-like repeat-containing protein n=1 Tax=Azospirillum canadense TaxID=403962 RepID=UPI00222654D6|nr:FG-GAP-like repeat-containing protein [Azospirillum canadense]MCW2241407.1 hypothetical protein [Azospirillum canadense]